MRAVALMMILAIVAPVVVMVGEGAAGCDKRALNST